MQQISAYVLPVLVIILLVVCIVKRYAPTTVFSSAQRNLFLSSKAFFHISHPFSSASNYSKRAVCRTRFRRFSQNRSDISACRARLRNSYCSFPYRETGPPLFLKNNSGVRRGFLYHEMRKRHSGWKRNGVLHIRRIFCKHKS